MTDVASTAVSSNGHGPPSADHVISAVRARPRNVLLLRGFGPLVAGILLYLLMLRLAPSVAPEHVVDVPVATTPTTAVVNP